MKQDSAKSAQNGDHKITPMMAQFLEIKQKNPGCLLFYRMGDFYELFFEDAEIASKILGITLTKRGYHQGQDIPMCGVPFHAADEYLLKLIASGHKVGVCEQLENPAEAKKRGAKSVVNRGVVRLVTPGTLTEERLLDAGQNNYLAAFAKHKSGSHPFALAWIDISTGSFCVRALTKNDCSSVLARINPQEIIISDSSFGDDDLATLFDDIAATVSPVPRVDFDSATAENRLCSYFGLNTLDGHGDFSRVELSAAAAILAYVEKTQLNARPPLMVPTRENAKSGMRIDASTRANLEIMQTLSGQKKGSLFDAVDCTVTGAGARALANLLAAPLTNLNEIIDRQDKIAWALRESNRLTQIRKSLKHLPDIARALTRLILDRGGPRDLDALKNGLAQASELADLLLGDDNAPIAKLHRNLSESQSGSLYEFQELLQSSLADELPLLKRDGGFVRNGFIEKLDAQRALRDNSRKVIAKLQQTYSEETNVKSLKIKHNNVLGYFVEVTAQNAPALQGDEGQKFIHRQTLANVMRFSTLKLGELEAEISGAGYQALEIELSHFDQLLEHTKQCATKLQILATHLAELDVVTSLATLAEKENFCRPKVDNTIAFKIEDGRHPVVEKALKENGEPFIANNCDLSAEASDNNGQIWLLTGPNMAGKSTFLRQNALITILAQIGSYVPATKAHIGIVDALFSRVGASDDLARGRSTFMVEMVETATILNQATSKSLVILDEIGRGTATYDGLSIAWAAVEHLHEVNGSRALFATHYHELTALSQSMTRLSNATVKVREWEGSIVFLHEIVEGAATSSYGIQVAELAGLPKKALSRARQVLRQLEAQERDNPKLSLIDDLPLFSNVSDQVQQAELTPQQESILLKIDELHPDELTPKQALELVYSLKSLTGDELK